MIKAMVLVHFYGYAGSRERPYLFRDHMLFPIQAPDWEALARMVNEDAKSWHDPPFLRPFRKEIDERLSSDHQSHQFRIMQIIPITDTPMTSAVPGQNCPGG